MSAYDFLVFIISWILPPLAVFMKRGIHSDFWLNILLTLLGWFPGMIHAWYVIYRYPHHRHWPAAPPAPPVV